MSTIIVNKNIAPLVEAMNNFVKEFLEGQGKRKAASTTKHWSADEVQTEFLKVIQDNMPKAPRVKKVTGPKDKDAPKKGRSSYIIYTQEVRAKVTAQMKAAAKKADIVKEDGEGDVKATDITKKLAEMWNGLSDKKKEKYTKLAIKDKARYEKEMESYEPSEEYLEKVEEFKASGGKVSKASNKKPKDEAAPKKNLTSYFFFAADNRDKVKEDNPELKGAAINKKLGEIWGEMSDEDKDGYVAKATEDKVRYEAAMEDYTPPEEYLEKVAEWEAAGGKVTKRGGGTKKRSTGPRKPRSAYVFYGQEMRPIVKEDNEDMEPKEVTKKVAEMWTEIKEDKKASKKWIKLAKEDKKRYENEMRTYVSEDEESDDEDESTTTTTAPKPKKAPRKKVEKVEKVDDVKDDDSDSSDDEDEVTTTTTAPKPKKSPRKASAKAPRKKSPPKKKVAPKAAAKKAPALDDDDSDDSSDDDLSEEE